MTIAIIILLLILFLIFLSLMKISKELARSNNILQAMVYSIGEIQEIKGILEEIKYVKFCETGMTTIKLKEAIKKDVESECG